MNAKYETIFLKYIGNERSESEYIAAEKSHISRLHERHASPVFSKWLARRAVRAGLFKTVGLAGVMLRCAHFGLQGGPYTADSVHNLQAAWPSLHQ
jgi:hypothetical protein